MIREIKIESYFQISDDVRLSAKDNIKLKELRDAINSFKTKEKQVEFIVSWRSKRENIDFDYRVFGISKNAILSKHLVNSNNEINKSLIGKRNRNWNGKKEVNIDEFFSQKENMSQLPGKKGKLQLIDPATLFWIFVGFLIFNVLIYMYGFITSVDSSPFKLSEGRLLKGGEVIGTPYINLEGFAKEKDGYKMPMDYALALSMGYEYTGQNYEGPDDLRGIGIYASEDFAWDGTDQFSKDNYALAGRWEHWSYTIEKDKWPNHAAYGNKSSDGVRTTGISPLYTNFDEAHYRWLLKQKVLVVNPHNGRAVICMIGNGVDNTNWGGSPLSSGPLGLSYKAQQALGFTAGGLEGDTYRFNCRDACSIHGFQLEAFWVLEPDKYPLGPVNIKLTPNVLPDPTPTPAPSPTPTPTSTPDPTATPVPEMISM